MSKSITYILGSTLVGCLLFLALVVFLLFRKPKSGSITKPCKYKNGDTVQLKYDIEEFTTKEKTLVVGSFYDEKNGCVYSVTQGDFGTIGGDLRTGYVAQGEIKGFWSYRDKLIK